MICTIILERLLPDRAVIWEDGEEKPVAVDKVKRFTEGDVLIRQDGGFILDIDGTEKRRKEIVALQDSLFDDE